MELLEGSSDLPEASRRFYCNRTLNLRSIRAIGFDMDYTLVHYRTHEWEREAYEDARGRLLRSGWPVSELAFDPELFTLGLILDTELGNVVKANRFGFVKRASHGTRMLSFEEQRAVYGRVLVDLAEPRWVFMNTLFSLSEACLYAQTVELLDAGEIKGTLGYADLYRRVRSHVDETHLEGKLKSKIVQRPDQYVVLDEDLPLALMDLKHAGKHLVLITNSEWHYTKSMLSYALDRFLPKAMTWRDLFDLKIVGARKPAFFTQQNPFFRVVNEEGLLAPQVGPLEGGGLYLGGNANTVEEHFGLVGEEILYVGDHIFADVHVSKSLLRWRTALVLREIEPELSALEQFKPGQQALTEKMEKKEILEHRYSQLRLALQRLEHGYGPQLDASAGELKDAMHDLRAELLALDQTIAPLAQEAGSLLNSRWGLLLRAGNDKSHLARQIERYADVYTSRVSNFLSQTPFVYMRSPRGSLPHDSGPAGGA